MILIFNSNLSFAATLPSDYTQLEYIESNGTQYIDSGIYPDKNTEIEMVVKTNGLETQYLFGVSGADGKRYMLAQSNGNLMFDFIAISNRMTSSVVGYTDFHKIEIKNQSFIVDGTTFGSFASENDFTQTNTAYVFDAHNNSWGSDTGAKIKYLKIWQSGTLVRDYIPAEYNGQIGMYDAVSGNFFTNAETHYTQLEYLTSNESKQYIEDTTFQTINAGAFEIKTKTLAYNTRFVGFGDSSKNNVSIALATNWTSMSGYRDIPASYSGWDDRSNNVDYNSSPTFLFRYEFAQGLQKLYINGTLNKQMTQSKGTDSNNFRLFNVTPATGAINGTNTIYYCKVFDENNLLKRHYIPVRRDSDGAIGMYEATTRAFLTNKGSGSFSVGPDTDLFVNSFKAGPVAVATCSASLNMLGDEMCVETIVPAWPYLTAWYNGHKYYIKLSENDYPIHSGSSNKIKIKINNDLMYSAHDNSVE